MSPLIRSWGPITEAWPVRYKLTYLIPEKHWTPGSGEILTCKTKASDRWYRWSSPSIVHFLAAWILTRYYLRWKLSAHIEAVPGRVGILVPRPHWLKDEVGSMVVRLVSESWQKEGEALTCDQDLLLGWIIITGCIWVQSGGAQGGCGADGPGDSRENKYKFDTT